MEARFLRDKPPGRCPERLLVALPLGPPVNVPHIGCVRQHQPRLHVLELVRLLPDVDHSYDAHANRPSSPAVWGRMAHHPARPPWTPDGSHAGAPHRRTSAPESTALKARRTFAPRPTGPACPCAGPPMAAWAISSDPIRKAPWAGWASAGFPATGPSHLAVRPSTPRRQS